MASYTTNLNLYKPDSTDDFEDFREEFNGNMDKIDGGNGNQNLAANYDDTATYAVGDYVIYNGLLYKCDTDVTSAETFDPTKWTRVLVTDEMGGGGGSGGHTIYDKDGNELTQESGLQFTGAVSVSDDSVNGRTVVDIEGGGNYYLNTIYSTEEKKVGYWTDNKPLYAKTYTANITANTQWIDTGLNSGDLIVRSEGTLEQNNGQILTLASGDTGAGAGINTFIVGVVTPSKWSCLYRTNNNDARGNLTLTLYYTKGSDTAEPNPQVGNVIYLPTIYSEEERQVGVWTDGKPLYQRTWVLNSDLRIPYFSWIDTPILKGDIEYIISSEFINESNNTWSDVSTAITSSQYIQALNSLNATITVRQITLRYTKTTDVAGSGEWTPSGARAVHYSTNEQVVGTWIDGKPLYERTISYISSTSAGVHNIETLTNIDNIVSMQGIGIYQTQKIPIPYYGGNNDFYLLWTDGANLQEYRGSANGFSGTQMYVTIQYTKTTD